MYLIARIGSKLKKREITLKEAIAWSIVWAGVGIVVSFPQIADRIASFIGLQTATGIDLVVYIAVGVLFWLVFRLFVKVEHMGQDITKLVRDNAIKKESQSRNQDKTTNTPEV